MANQLKKLALVQYTPGTPYVPATTEYCYTTTQWVGSVGQWVQEAPLVTRYTDPETGETRIIYNYGELVWVPGTGYNKTVEVCYPATPAVEAVPATLTYSAVTGWNGGGRSIDPLTGDGAFRFNVSGVPSAVVVGLVREDTSTLPSEPSHAFYVYGTTVDIMESGTVVATSPHAHSVATPMAISRVGTTVTYLHNGWTYTSTVPSTGDQYLDAAIYASGDFVDNPELLPSLALNGTASGSLPILFAVASDDATPEYAIAGGSLPYLFASATGLTGEVGSAAGSLPLFAARLSDYAYSEARGSLPLFVGGGYGGYPEVSLVTAVGAIPPVAAWARGLTGEVGSASGNLQLFAAQATDRAGYGAARGGIPLLTGGAVTTVDLPYPAANSRVVATDFYFADRNPSAYARSALTVQDSYTLSMLVDGGVFDSLALSDSTSAYRLLTALAQSGLLLGADSSTGSVAAQYAVNVLTNALTTYDGMDFLQFARTDTAVYAVRSDGLYRLRPGDDNGSPISVYVDFGETDFGSVKTKAVEQVFLGLSTDGDVLVTLRSDDTDRVYRAIQRGPLMRVNGARGVTARRWNLSLEVVDATELHLDTLEQLVAVSTRRWTR